MQARNHLGRVGIVPMAVRGGTFSGFLAGLLIGLGTAVAVAIFVTKAPVPFLNKAARPPERLLDPKSPETAPDPNRPLFSRNRVDPSSAAVPPAELPPAPGAPVETARQADADSAARPPEARPADRPPEGASRPLALPVPPPGAVAPQPPPAPPPAPPPKASQSVAPAPAAAPASAPAAVAAPASTSSAPASADGFVLQAGAFRTVEDAEQMRSRLALLGFESRLIASEVNGLAVQRVRIGPFSRIEDMNRARAKLTENSIEVSVVRVR